MSDQPYYAKDGVVWKAPVQTKNADGSTTISIGFPVCTMHDAVGADAAESVAALMNLGHTAEQNQEAPLSTAPEHIADEPIVTLRMSRSQAEQLSCSLSDVLCWLRGWMAASPKLARAHTPMGVDDLRSLNISLKTAITKAEAQ